MIPAHLPGAPARNGLPARRAYVYRGSKPGDGQPAAPTAPAPARQAAGRGDPIDHGTTRGYAQHRRMKQTPACPQCRAAHNAGNKAFKAAVTARGRT